MTNLRKIGVIVHDLESHVSGCEFGRTPDPKGNDGISHIQLTYRHAGRDFRLTEIHRTSSPDERRPNSNLCLHSAVSS